MTYQIFIPEICAFVRFSRKVSESKTGFIQLSLNDNLECRIHAQFPGSNILSVEHNKQLIGNLRGNGFTDIMISSDGLKIFAYLDNNSVWQSNEVDILSINHDIGYITMTSVIYAPETEIDRKHMMYLFELNNVRYKEEFTRNPRPTETTEFINLFGVSVALSN